MRVLIAFGAGVVVGLCAVPLLRALGMWRARWQGDRLDVCTVERRQMWIRERR